MVVLTLHHHTKRSHFSSSLLLLSLLLPFSHSSSSSPVTDPLPPHHNGRRFTRDAASAPSSGSLNGPRERSIQFGIGCVSAFANKDGTSSIISGSNQSFIYKANPNENGININLPPLFKSNLADQIQPMSTNLSITFSRLDCAQFNRNCTGEIVFSYRDWIGLERLQGFIEYNSIVAYGGRFGNVITANYSQRGAPYRSYNPNPGKLKHFFDFERAFNRTPFLQLGQNKSVDYNFIIREVDSSSKAVLVNTTVTFDNSTSCQRDIFTNATAGWYGTQRLVYQIDLGDMRSFYTQSEIDGGAAAGLNTKGMWWTLAGLLAGMYIWTM